MESARRINKLGDTYKEYLPQHMLKNLLQTSQSILKGDMSLGNGDCLAGRPEQWGWDMGRVKGRRASQHAFCSPEAAGTLSCSQITRKTAATTRSWAGLAPEQAPWLQAQQAGEAPEGGIPHQSKQHSVPCPGSCLCLQPALEPSCTVCWSAPPAHPLGGLRSKATIPAGAELV